MCESLSWLVPLFLLFVTGALTGILVLAGIQQLSAPSEYDKRVAQIHARGAQGRAEVDQLKQAYTNTTVHKAEELKRKRKSPSTEQPETML